MRFLASLPLLGLATGFVIDEKVFNDIKEAGQELLENSQSALDTAIEKFTWSTKQLNDKVYEVGYDVEAWLSGSPYTEDTFDVFDEPHPPHHPPPHHPPPDHPPHQRPPHHKPPHHGKPHHPHVSNLTVYELINKSKYTTELAKIINEYPELVELLNGTKANYTLFAPTDEAFKKLPKNGKEPSKEYIKGALLHHISDQFYPKGRLLHSYTLPTLYKPDNLGHEQRLTVRFTLHGPAIDFYSHLVATNIFASNGVIHGIDHVLVPPPQILDIVKLLPGEFSTFELALVQTGLWPHVNSTEHPRSGGTAFVPSNFAFKKLGPKINAFLFSKYGEKYLKALMKYHLVANQTLYSDAFFGAPEDEDQTATPPYSHIDLPTALGPPLAVDIFRRGLFIFIKVNGFTRVYIHDGVASDGVIQVVNNVLIPPKKVGRELVQWEGEDLSEDEFKERFDPYLNEDVEDVEENMEM
jgi:uncharacterized surface protein with fasciclin (FAS1) repeats